MSDINWKDGAVCYTDWIQWSADRFNFEDALCMHLVDLDDFQLNEIREGDFIPASELDTEQKYNDAVEVFELFGFDWGKDASTSYFDKNSPCDKLRANEDGLFKSDFSETSKTKKLTYPQIIAIGKLKRAMIERDEALINAVENTSILSDVLNGNPPEIPDSSKRNKSKQAYEILKSLDYEYDLVKQKWFKKEYV